MEDYNRNKIDIEPMIKLSEEKSLKKYQLKGKDNKYYNIKIIFQEKSESILFKVKTIGDFTELIYTKTLLYKDFCNLNRFFRQYISIQEIYSLFISNLKNKDLIVFKNKNVINIHFNVLSLNKKEKINIILNEEKISLDKMVKKICEKIKDMEKIGKLKESKNYLQNESKLLLIYILIILFIINIVMIIFIYTEKRNLDKFKLKNNKEINYLKEQIKGLKNKQTETKKSENLIKKDFKEFDYLEYYLGNHDAFDLLIINKIIKI